MWRARAEQIAQTVAAFPKEKLESAVTLVYATDKALRDTRPDDRVVMELSSFQLEYFHPSANAHVVDGVRPAAWQSAQTRPSSLWTPCLKASASIEIESVSPLGSVVVFPGCAWQPRRSLSPWNWMLCLALC